MQGAMPGRGEGGRPGSASGGGKAQHVKLVLLGDQGVGKSSIALRFVRGEFSENSEATIGAAFLTQTVNVQNQSIKFDIWDTAGQERYRSLAPMYYRGAQASIVVYDVNSTQSFQHAISWVQELRQQANAQTVIALAGNKADMAATNRAIERHDAQAYAEEQGLIFVETSAKTGLGVSDVFLAVANTLAQRLQEGTTAARTREGVKLTKAENKKGGCC